MNTLILLSRKKVLNSLINKANNIGLKLQPWRKPNGISKISEVLLLFSLHLLQKDKYTEWNYIKILKYCFYVKHHTAVSD